jgi:hypothetical protein
MGYPDGGLCAGELLLLSTDYTENLQWYRDSVPLIPGDEPVIEVQEGGLFTVSHTSAAGCRVFANAIQVEFSPLPEIPVFVQEQNLLSIFDLSSLPVGAQLQWFLDGAPLDDALDTIFCISSSGFYSLRVTDTLTGCSSTYGLPINYNPLAPPCATDVESYSSIAPDFRVWPNPAADVLWIEWQGVPISPGPIRLYDLHGRLVWSLEAQSILPGQPTAISIPGLPSGLYVLQWAGTGTLVMLK